MHMVKPIFSQSLPKIILHFTLLLHYCVIILHEVYPVIFLHSSCLDTYCDLAPRLLYNVLCCTGSILYHSCPQPIFIALKHFSF